MAAHSLKSRCEKGEILNETPDSDEETKMDTKMKTNLNIYIEIIQVIHFSNFF